jgi:hypothetical protein
MLEEFKGGEFLASEAVFFFLIADKKKHDSTENAIINLAC